MHESIADRTNGTNGGGTTGFINKPKFIENHKPLWRAHPEGALRLAVAAKDWRESGLEFGEGIDDFPTNLKMTDFGPAMGASHLLRLETAPKDPRAPEALAMLADVAERQPMTAQGLSTFSQIPPSMAQCQCEGRQGQSLLTFWEQKT